MLTCLRVVSTITDVLTVAQAVDLIHSDCQAPLAFAVYAELLDLHLRSGPAPGSGSTLNPPWCVVRRGSPWQLVGVAFVRLCRPHRVVGGLQGIFVKKTGLSLID